MSLLARLVVFATLLPAAVCAQDPYVPEDLQGWQEWVLHDKEYRDCSFIFDRRAVERGEFICAWPGSLQLEIGANGGAFTQAWTVYAEPQWLSLPGSVDYWPHRVTANGNPVAVVLRRNTPSVWLPPGRYRISGSFAWDERPGNLAVPAETGLLELNVDGQAVDRPERNRNAVFLGERRQQMQARNTVKTNVYRLVGDDIPTRLTTRLLIQVSGNVREELFGPLLPDGFVPLGITADLPARLEPDGNLRLQVRPGLWTVEVTARAGEVVDTVTMPAGKTNLPATEIWSFAVNDELRVAAPEGLTPVDPQQADVPEDWIELPAFRVQANESLQINERSRGMVSADNDLRLMRTMWLAFDGSGFMVEDDIVGSMRSDWRLDMLPPFELLSAMADDRNLLITESAAEGRTGVELRYRDLDLQAIAEADARGTMPVTGWAARFDNAAAVLNLPPGHKLLAAPGVDRAPGSWVSQWQLVDFFVVLIIGIASWRLFGTCAGLIALAAMVLSYQEMAAPSWLWLNLLIAVALMRVAPLGRLRQATRIYLGISAVLLLFVLLPFAANQLRIAIYPQLETQRGPSMYAPAPVPEADMAYERQSEEMEAAKLRTRDSSPRSATMSDAVEEIVVSGSRIDSYYEFSRYAPNAIVQAGAGIPSWRWNSYRLDWNGPVTAEQNMRLVVMPRWLVSLLRVLEVLMLVLFVAVFASEILKRPIRFPGGWQVGRSATAAGLCLMFLLPATYARAQLPDAEMLRALEERLLPAPDCVPRCAETLAADIEIVADSVRMSLTIHALEEVAVPLPGSDAGWRPGAIRLDGTDAGEIVRGPERALWVRLPAGRHVLTLSGPIPAVDSLEIPFPMPPRVVEAAGGGWDISGVKDRRLLSGALQLSRLESSGGDDSSVRWESSRFPPFVEVTRSLRLDLDWSVSTTVRRIAPARGALSLELPLLDGESVLSENREVDDGTILISMSADDDEVSWNSSLERASTLSLHAAEAAAWQEIWRIGVSNVWHVEFSGLPETENPSFDDNARVALFYPRGGETLTLETRRPEASAGSTLAFDSVGIQASQGERSRDVTMTLEYRSTRGSQHTLSLPAEAEVTSVIIDGQAQSLRARDSQLVLPILPGTHDVRMMWRSPQEAAARQTTPAVDIDGPASNILLRLDLPRNRWVLATAGPALGPAVLYWSELAVLVLAAFILGRIPLTPLRTWEWFLLGLGFSTFAWWAAALVVVWLLAAGARERWQLNLSWWQFNLRQIVFAALTVVALGVIVTQLPLGLIGTPDMHVAGNGSQQNSLRWFADQSDSALPQATVISAPLWIYKVLILAWALWLSFALIRWLPWVWRSFASRGFWRPRDAVVAEEPAGT